MLKKGIFYIIQSSVLPEATLNRMPISLDYGWWVIGCYAVIPKATYFQFLVAVTPGTEMAAFVIQ
jgi:hypothetical protein